MSWIEITTEGNSNGAIRTGVRDYGGGIPEETRERASSILSSPRKRRGWGRGLTIVRSVVESHAGTMATDNVEGEGARFHFTLSANAPASR